MSNCSACYVAHYCDHDWQKASWGYHKDRCAKLLRLKRRNHIEPLPFGKDDDGNLFPILKHGGRTELLTGALPAFRDDAPGEPEEQLIKLALVAPVAPVAVLWPLKVLLEL